MFSKFWLVQTIVGGIISAIVTIPIVAFIYEMTKSAIEDHEQELKALKKKQLPRFPNSPPPQPTFTYTPRFHHGPRGLVTPSFGSLNRKPKFIIKEVKTQSNHCLKHNLGMRQQVTPKSFFYHFELPPLPTIPSYKIVLFPPREDFVFFLPY